MIELLVVFALARHNGNVVEAKGQSGTMYRWLTAGLWFGCEFGGALIGAVMAGRGAQLMDIYPFALLGAALGGAISWVIARQVAPNPIRMWNPEFLTPPAGLPAWTQPDPAVPPALVIPGNVELVVESRMGDWALIRGFNGWRGYVDARALVRKPGPAVWSAQPQA
jgi:hypothetical protein